jgi:hypothetical protein
MSKSETKWHVAQTDNSASDVYSLHMDPTQALYLILTFVVAGSGAYLGACLKKKVENLAANEHLGKLVDQIKVVTDTTKRIEADISQEVWDRKKQWEIKRDALMDVLREFGKLQMALVNLNDKYKQCGPSDKDEDLLFHADQVVDAVEGFKVVYAQFYHVLNIAQLVSGQDVAIKLDTLNSKVTALIETTTQFGGYNSSVPPTFQDVRDALVELLSAIRLELKLDR